MRRRRYFTIHPSDDEAREGIPPEEGELFRYSHRLPTGLEIVRSVRTGQTWAWSGGGDEVFGPALHQAIINEHEARNR